MVPINHMSKVIASGSSYGRQESLQRCRSKNLPEPQWEGPAPRDTQIWQADHSKLVTVAWLPADATSKMKKKKKKYDSSRARMVCRKALFLGLPYCCSSVICTYICTHYNNKQSHEDFSSPSSTQYIVENIQSDSYLTITTILGEQRILPPLPGILLFWIYKFLHNRLCNNKFWCPIKYIGYLSTLLDFIIKLQKVQERYIQ